ncbi:phosphate ABC transporter permease subunit PstC [Clostridium thermosuccinogenes]|jgi:phosphate transport system permease protein|uniref:Phosphate transport system permease protein n=1 Tax=Clostridium thermosuccinogenes TaxID=84032 RepID=A0A2K2FRS7_9CLOT|nr:phosphate ABC transporter permease subunit PstC [Pseudoclostridium thermosuccinogenes]AUS97850.1 phosphate ABC transporter permease subunit PstC [Pseudoclostridium thermosuccinogenes]PNU00146.1 phosphate ABC transporter permease subunit PstC [Pseudoclostridium thermosuccinogenes]PNU01470.1 phosphate ABC transporter permease subunit PstC [Pseudoclostridium thermosuccinogenes]
MKGFKAAFERIIEIIFLICACASILSVAVITVYMFVKGSPAIFEIGLVQFLTGTEWLPNSGKFGILPMLVASIYGTFGAVVIGVVVGLFTAIFLAEIGPSWLVRLFRPAIELLAGIPSVVYGFFGLVAVIPMIRNNIGGVGNSLMAVIFILSIMILPTIISVSETSIRAVPESYKEGSLALGATKIQTIFRVTLPAARSGIMAAIVLGIGRALGETMAVILVAGNSVALPGSLLDSVRTLTANIALEMSYASGLHREALFATGVVLFVFIMVLNIVLNLITHKRVSFKK